MIRSVSVIKDLLTCILRIEGAIVVHGRSYGFIECQEVFSLNFVQSSSDKKPSFNFSDVLSVILNIFFYFVPHSFSFKLKSKEICCSNVFC